MGIFRPIFVSLPFSWKFCARKKSKVNFLPLKKRRRATTTYVLLSSLQLLLLLAYGLAAGPRDDDDVKQEEPCEPLELHALGRVQALGSLYNAVNNTFLGFNILRGNPKRFTTKVDASSVIHDFNIVRTLSDRLNVFSLTATAQGGIDWWIIKSKTSAKATYSRQSRSKTTDVVGTLSYRIHTVEETLNVFHDKLKPFLHGNVVADFLEETATVATHIVVGIKWGADMFINFIDDARNSSSKTDSETTLTHVTQCIWPPINRTSVTTTINRHRSTVKLLSEFKIHVNGDLQPDKMPGTEEEVFQLVRSIPTLLKKIGGGKGVEQLYYLMPLKPYLKYLNVLGYRNWTGFEAPKIYTVPIHVTKEMLAFEDRRELLEIKIKEITGQMLLFEKYMHPIQKGRLKKLQDDFSKLAVLQGAALQRAFMRARAGEESPREIQRLLQSFEEGDGRGLPEDLATLKDLESEVDNGFRNIRQKMEIVALLTEKKVTWITDVNDINMLTKAFLGEQRHAASCMANYYEAYGLGDNFLAFKQVLKFFQIMVKALKTYQHVYIFDCEFNERLVTCVDGSNACGPLPN